MYLHHKTVLTFSSDAPEAARAPAAVIWAEMTSVVDSVVEESDVDCFRFFFLMRTPVADAPSETMSIDIFDESELADLFPD